jgi:hypothetical protein
MPTRTQPAGRPHGPARHKPAAAAGDDRIDPRLERRLDEALEQTFPASDPVAFPLRSD